MPDRRAFITAVVAGGAAASLAGREATAQDATASPVPSPSPSSSPKPPSAAALAVAGTMRAFDAHLTDDDLTTIAHAIDDGRTGRKLNPKGRALKNGDEPVTRFSVPMVDR